MPPSPLRRPALACLLLLVGALGCAHERERPSSPEPTPPSVDEERDRTRRCMTLAEAFYGASYPREVIALASGSPRMDADDESLAPLLACLQRARLDDARWPKPLVRSLAHAHGAALWSSRMPREERFARLDDESVQADIALYWQARMARDTDDGSERERLLRLALDASPGDTPASLALALELTRQGRPGEGAALLEGMPESARPDLQVYVQGAAALARGERHQASALLERLLDGELPSTSPNGPDALALRSQTLPEPSPLLCEAGRAHAKAGERADALRAFRAASCFEELTLLHLDEGDGFTALLTSYWASPETHVRALEAAGAYGLLRARLEGLARRCEALLGGERCEEHRSRLSGLDVRARAKSRSVGFPAEDDEVRRRALGLLFHDDERALLTSAAESPRPPERGDVIDLVIDPRGGRVLVQALQPSVPRSGLPAAERLSVVLVEKTAQGWRASRFTREMALSPGGA